MNHSCVKILAIKWRVAIFPAPNRIWKTIPFKLQTIWYHFFKASTQAKFVQMLLRETYVSVKTDFFFKKLKHKHKFDEVFSLVGETESWEKGAKSTVSEIYGSLSQVLGSQVFAYNSLYESNIRRISELWPIGQTCLWPVFIDLPAKNNF